MSDLPFDGAITRYFEKDAPKPAVLDGAIRDLAYVREHAFPVFAAGVTHRRHEDHMCRLVSVR